MSQSSSQALDPSWVSVSFAKFSHNSSPYGARNFTWHHVGSRNDLDVVLRNTRLVDENGNFCNRLFMKISAGSEELEQQDLYELLQYLQAFDPSSGGECPVQVVVKSPFLAMRYPKSANIVRRIQLKFHNEADFTKVLNIVKDLGLPITGSLPASTPAPPSSSRPSISPSPSVSHTSTSTSLTAPSMLSSSSVSSSHSISPLQTPGLSFSPALRGTNEYSSSISDPLTSVFKMPARPNSSYSEPQKPSSSLSHAIPQILRPATTSNYFPLPGPQFSQSFMQSPASVYIKQSEKESQNRHHLLDLSVMKSCQDQNGPGLPLYQSQMDLQNRSASTRTQYPEPPLVQSPFFAARTVSPEMRQSMARELNVLGHDHESQEVATQGFHKRNAALFEAAEAHRLSIPPRRELPFPKPRDIAPRSASVSLVSPLTEPTPGSRPRSASSTRGPTKDQTEQQHSAPTTKPTKKRVAQRKSTLVKPPEIAESPPPPQEQVSNSDTASALAAPHDEPSPLAAKSFAAASIPGSAGLKLQTKAAATGPKKRAAPTRQSPVPKRPKMVDQSTQTDIPPSCTAPTALQLAPNDVSAVTAVSPPQDYLDAVDTFVAKHKARPAPKEVWEEPGWAEADAEERHRILNNFICENLENKDFIQLCEDVRVSWRRMMGIDI
ncbi:hypothetical protein D0Z07_7961 [Hyphodiscus hymeniophilus]|uniref:Uncharacterized protein n=1 Tax=Hyphodiscus hymeniophilus TaxID=353542 RepID=A0A9P6VDY5_9HELO|nr:hypothetical protein D0Z07_7961 [Hyphodiscus hymeniophilus]